MSLLPCPPSWIQTDPDFYAKLPKLEVPLGCQHPTCECWGAERHHVVRRSEIGASDWVTIRGVVLPNVVRLCGFHHLQITGSLGGHKGWIRHLPGEGWAWYAPCPPGSVGIVSKTGTVWQLVGPLKENRCNL